jgi:hypothetical protein
MGEVVTVGLDLAKTVFPVHGVDGAGEVVVRRQLRRAQVLPVFAKLPPCLIGIEACATAHYWGRGWSNFWPSGARRWRRWPWPTRSPGSPGPS